MRRSPSPRRRHPRWRFRLTRDLVLFGTALGLLVFEAVVRHGKDPGVLEICGLLLGAPAVLRSEEFRRRDRDDK